MASVGTHGTPRSYRKHVRRSRFARTRRSGQFLEFLSVQADRLSSSGYEATLFDRMNLNSADQIRAADTLSDLA